MPLVRLNTSTKRTATGQKPSSVMFKNPIVQSVLTVLAVIVVLKMASGVVTKILVVGKYLEI